MYSVTVDEVENVGVANRPTASRTEVAWHSFAVFQMPAIFGLAPGQHLGLGAGVAPIVLPDCRSLFVEVEPVGCVPFTTGS